MRVLYGQDRRNRLWKKVEHDDGTVDITMQRHTGGSAKVMPHQTDQSKVMLVVGNSVYTKPIEYIAWVPNSDGLQTDSPRDEPSEFRTTMLDALRHILDLEGSDENN